MAAPIHDGHLGRVLHLEPRLAVRPLIFEDRQPETVANQAIDVVLFSGQEQPALGIRAHLLGVAVLHLWRVVVWIDGDGNQQEVRFLSQGGLQPPHRFTDLPAGPAAASEREGGDPDLAPEILQAHDPAAALGEGKVRQPAEVVLQGAAGRPCLASRQHTGKEEQTCEGITHVATSFLRVPTVRGT